jgi:hypothetical protein
MREDASRISLLRQPQLRTRMDFQGEKRLKLFKNEPLVARAKVINTELDKMKQNK